LNCLFEASTSTTTTSATTTLPPVQIEDPSDIIRQCQQPIVIGTLLTTTVVGVATTAMFGVLFSKMATSALKPPSVPKLRK
jgi:multisubunit Na+/H+ antiporter MnhC subunit